MKNLLLGSVLGLIICVISYKLGFLTKSGAFAAFFLAILIFGLGGIMWSTPLVAFFLTSSALSLVRKKNNPDVELFFEKTGTRDYLQVISNGGFGAVLILVNLISPNEILYLIYLSVLASVCADTWATEIGTLRKTDTYNITTLKKINQGQSGGISLSGFAGAILGSVFISFSGLFWLTEQSILLFSIITFCGFFGSVVDSFLGATFQLGNMCLVCGKLTERQIHCNKEVVYHKGLKWMSNDAVNLISGIAGGLLNWMIIELFLKKI